MVNLASNSDGSKIAKGKHLAIIYISTDSRNIGSCQVEKKSMPKYLNPFE